MSNIAFAFRVITAINMRILNNCDILCICCTIKVNKVIIISQYLCDGEVFNLWQKVFLIDFIMVNPINRIY